MAAGIAWLFYQSMIAMLLLLPLPFVYCRYRIGMDREHYRKVVSGQFRELLNCVNNALRAGDSPENAFREGYREVRYEYGEFAPVTVEMGRVTGAEVFRIAKRGGGNMTEILARTSALIEERMDVENEIRIMLGNRQLEQRIMDLTPFMIIFYIGVTSPGFFDVLYHNPEGAAFMTLCLAAYFGALLLSEKILAVTV